MLAARSVLRRTLLALLILMPLTFSSIPTFFDLSDSVLVAGEPDTDQAMQDLSHNAKYAAVRSEVIYMGFFANGATVPLPVSPVDGYAYSQSEVQYKVMWISSRAPGAGFTNGQKTRPRVASGQPTILYHHECDVDDSSGAVYSLTSYYKPNGAETVTNDGIVKVFCMCQRSDVSSQAGVITAPGFSRNPQGPLPWNPYYNPPAQGDEFWADPYDVSLEFFGIQPVYKQNADGSAGAYVNVLGIAPVNVFSPTLAFPPVIGLVGTASTGGYLKGGQYYYGALTAVDSDGNQTRPSYLFAIFIPSGANTNVIMLNNLTWPSGTDGWALYLATSPQQLSLQGGNAAFGGWSDLAQFSYTDTVTAPTSITMLGTNVSFYSQGFRVREFGLPDVGVSFIRLKAKPIVHSGVAGTQVISVTDATHMAIDTQGNSGFSTNQFAGRSLMLLGKYDGSQVKVADYLISANDDGTVTAGQINITLANAHPSPTVDAPLVAHDIVVINSQVTAVGSDSTGDYIEDSLFANPYSPGGTGLTVAAEAGNVIRFLTGGNTGYTAIILTNTATRLYIVGTWPVATPTVGDAFIVEAPNWLGQADQSAMTNAGSLAAPVVSSFQIEVDNIANSELLISAVSVRADGTESPDGENPFRLIWMFGHAGTLGGSVQVASPF